MWSRGGPRSSVLDRAKAQLSGQRISNNGKSKDKRDVENPGKYMSPSKQMQFQDLNDILSPSESENQDPVKTTTLESFSMGGGSRFLKTSKDATGDRLSSAPTGSPAGIDEFKFIPQRSSQSAALNRLALIENRIRNQKSKSDGPSIHINLSEPQETRLSVQSSSDLSMTGSHFLKKRTVSAPQEQKVPERASGLNECKEMRDSLDSDEQDMRRLLGDSFSLSEGSLQNAVRKKSPQPVKKLYKKSSEMSTVPSPAPQRHKALSHQSLSPPHSRPESRMVRCIEHSMSSETDHSEVLSLDDLFPLAAAPDSDDTLSERSAGSDDFKLKVMTLDDLAPMPFEAAEILQKKKETQARTEDGNKKSSNNISKVASPPTQEDTLAAYESDFESDIPSEMPQSTSEISESLTDKDKDASLISEAQYSTYKSQDGDYDDHNLSQSSSSSHHSDSSSRSSLSNATVTHGPSPDRHVKEVAVQTQTNGLTYTWSSGMAAVGPSVGMAYVDPTPIASHTVSAEAIESLTAYSPAVTALNDMMRQQLDLTRAFIDSTRRHYTSVIESLGPADYKYTTLEDTKEFIHAHRPPKLSVEDALEKVLQEMRDYHYS